MSTSNKLPAVNPLLKNLTNALYVTTGGDIAIRTGIEGNVNITGPVTIPGEVTVNSSPENPVHVHVTESIPIALDSATLSALEHISIDNFPATQTVNGTVALDSATLSALETTTVNQGTGGTSAWKITGTVSVDSLPEVEVKNDSGNPLSISKNTSANSTTNRIYVSMETDAVIADSNYEMNVARGLVTGHQSIVRSAYNPTVSANTLSSVWVEGGIYPFTTWTSASRLYVASDSASDVGQSILVEGLDSNYVYQSEYITTNGTNAVQTANTYIRIWTATIVSSSVANTNAGEIRFRITSASGTVVAHIRAGIGMTKLAQFTVPANHTAYVLYGDCSSYKSGNGQISTTIQMDIRPFGGAFVAGFIAVTGNGYYRNDFNVPLVLPAKSDVDVRVLCDGNSAVSANWQMILISN